MTVGISYIAYSRADKCKETLGALCDCQGIEGYDIHIFSDAPYDKEIESRVAAVRNYLHDFVHSHKELNFYLHEARTNKGSFDHISSALQSVSQMYDYVILIEEDVLVGRSFLNYMASAIHYYEDVPKVFALSGYNPVPDLNVARDTFFSDRLCCYGLCMKSSDIQAIEWDINKLDLKKIDKKRFYHAAKDISACFDDDVHGNREFTTSWDIILYYNMLLCGKYQVIPRRSYCTNIGFDGSGEWSPAGGFKNDNFEKDIVQDTFRFEKTDSIAEGEYERFLKGFIQDSPKKKLLRAGRRISSFLHISRFARLIKNRYLR